MNLRNPLHGGDEACKQRVQLNFETHGRHLQIQGGHGCLLKSNIFAIRFLPSPLHTIKWFSLHSPGQCSTTRSKMLSVCSSGDEREITLASKPKDVIIQDPKHDPKVTADEMLLRLRQNNSLLPPANDMGPPCTGTLLPLFC